MVPVICIDDQDRPDEIPVEKWVKKGQQYHVIHLFYCHPQQTNGVVLKEIKLDDSNYPYESFKFARFAIHPEHIEAFITLMKACTDLNDLDIRTLINEEFEIQQYND